MYRTANICLLIMLFSVTPGNAHATEEDYCCLAVKGSLVVTGVLSLAALAVTTLVYPPVVTTKLLEDENDGLKSCFPSRTLEPTIEDDMKMAKIAFIANAIVTPMAAISLSLAFFNQKVIENRVACGVLHGLGATSLVLGLGAGLIGIVQSQKAYNQIFSENTEPCVYQSTNGRENERKHELTTILGFSYFDAVVKSVSIAFWGYSVHQLYHTPGQCCCNDPESNPV